MRRALLLLLAIVLIVTMFTSVVAADTRAGGTVVIEEGESVNGLSATAGTVIVEGTVNGDLRAYGGDVIVTGASANVDGYVSELERTMFVGEPDDQQVHYFEVMREAQTLAIEALGPGVALGYVDDTVAEYFDEQGVAELAQHHVGHNIGLEGHEPPYIDGGWRDHCESEHTKYDVEDAEMAPGHVYTIEPASSV